MESTRPLEDRPDVPLTLGGRLPSAVSHPTDESVVRLPSHRYSSFTLINSSFRKRDSVLPPSDVGRVSVLPSTELPCTKHLFSRHPRLRRQVSASQCLLSRPTDLLPDTISMSLEKAGVFVSFLPFLDAALLSGWRFSRIILRSSGVATMAKASWSRNDGAFFPRDTDNVPERFIEGMVC